MRTLYFDCFCGASGDMIVGSLLDAGADIDELRVALQSLNVHGFEVKADKVVKHGITATQFSVLVREEPHHHHPHRHLADVLEIIEHGALPKEVKAAAAKTFERIALCESQIHGTTTEEVHFHEVGAVDSIVDIVGAHLALHQLGIGRVLSSPLTTGFGTVKMAHGVLPVPAPATAKLIEGVPSVAGDLAGEMLTPTGAALITQRAEAYGPAPAMVIQAIGYGCGTRDLPDRPNTLRVLIGETADTLPHTERVAIMEANIDDMNPELLPPLMARLLESGARDVFLTPILGKKGRPACLLTVICDSEKTGTLAEVMFRESTTFGVRMRTEERWCLRRDWKKVRTSWGTIRVKVGYLDQETVRMSPEFEDCRALAEQHKISVGTVYDEARAAALRGEWEDA